MDDLKIMKMLEHNQQRRHVDFCRLTIFVDSVISGPLSTSFSVPFGSLPVPCVEVFEKSDKAGKEKDHLQPLSPPKIF